MSGFYLAVSTSSPVTSVAFLGPDWDVLWSDSLMAPRAATAACSKLIRQGLEISGFKLGGALGFGCDAGPGSFTGVRVGVMVAKTLAFANGTRVFSAPAFDLISVSEVVSVPSRKNQWWVREPGQPPFSSEEQVGLGYPNGPAAYPLAVAFSLLRGNVELQSAMELVPLYLAEPAISQPNKPLDFRSRVQ